MTGKGGRWTHFLIWLTFPWVVTEAINCRSSLNKSYDSLSGFNNDTCALCYRYMIEESFAAPSFFFYAGGLCKNVSYCDYINIDTIRQNEEFASNVLSTFKNDFFKNLFIQCCEDATKCCTDRMMLSKPTNDENLYCPSKWDGWSCWDFAEAGTISTQTCPDYAYQIYETHVETCLRGSSSKQCNVNGAWFTYNTEEYTNYTGCASYGKRDETYRARIELALLTVSLILLVVSIGVFVYYKQYRIVRVQIHLNFFISSLFTCVSKILLELMVMRSHIQEVGTKEQIVSNLCIPFHIAYKASRLTNYFWMLCEGIYLHKLIVAAFQDQTRTLHFYVIGWFLPTIIIVLYCMVHSLKRFNTECWLKSMGNYEWIFTSGPALCLTVNLALLCNTIRILFTKLRSSPKHFKSALRATCILIPVFGIHYLFYMAHPQLSGTCSDFKEFLLYVGTIVDSLQGAFISSIFCFFNSEIHSLVKRSLWRRFRVSEAVTEEQDTGRF